MSSSTFKSERSAGVFGIIVFTTGRSRLKLILKSGVRSSRTKTFVEPKQSDRFLQTEPVRKIGQNRYPAGSIGPLTETEALTGVFLDENIEINVGGAWGLFRRINLCGWWKLEKIIGLLKCNCWSVRVLVVWIRVKKPLNLSYFLKNSKTFLNFMPSNSRN